MLGIGEKLSAFSFLGRWWNTDDADAADFRGLLRFLCPQIITDYFRIYNMFCKIKERRGLKSCQFSVLRSSQLSAISFLVRWFKFSVVSCQLSVFQCVDFLYFSLFTIHFSLLPFPFYLLPFTFHLSPFTFYLFLTAENAEILRKERREIKPIKMARRWRGCGGWMRIFNS